MPSIITVIVVVFLVGVLIPKKDNKESFRNSSASVILPYITFILFLAFSPVIGVFIVSPDVKGDAAKILFRYIWIGIAASLPISLLTAQLFGHENLERYWLYLEKIGGHSREVISYSWGCATGLALAAALAIALIP